MKQAALYCRVSTIGPHPETQLSELRQFAANRGSQVVGEYTDHGYCGAQARRPRTRTHDGRRPATQVRRAAGLGMRQACAFDQSQGMRTLF